MYLIKLTANYRSISIIRTSFSIVRPSIHIDIIIDRHYFIYYFHFAFPYFPSLLPCFASSLLLALLFYILRILSTWCLMTDNFIWPTDRADTSGVYNKFIHLFLVQYLSLPCFVIVQVVYITVSADIRTAKYRSIVVETSVHENERVCHLFIFLFISFLFFFFSFLLFPRIIL